MKRLRTVVVCCRLIFQSFRERIVLYCFKILFCWESIGVVRVISSSDLIFSWKKRDKRV